MENAGCVILAMLLIGVCLVIVFMIFSAFTSFSPLSPTPM
jgi:hypothetical protein